LINFHAKPQKKRGKSVFEIGKAYVLLLMNILRGKKIRAIAKDFYNVLSEEFIATNTIIGCDVET
jgi:hypothetical protein